MRLWGNCQHLKANAPAWHRLEPPLEPAVIELIGVRREPHVEAYFLMGRARSERGRDSGCANFWQRRFAVRARNERPGPADSRHAHSDNTECEHAICVEPSTRIDNAGSPGARDTTVDVTASIRTAAGDAIFADTVATDTFVTNSTDATLAVTNDSAEHADDDARSAARDTAEHDDNTSAQRGDYARFATVRGASEHDTAGAVEQQRHHAALVAVEPHSTGVARDRQQQPTGLFEVHRYRESRM